MLVAEYIKMYDYRQVYGHSKDAAVAKVVGRGLDAHTHQGRTTSPSLSLFSNAHFFVCVLCVCVLQQAVGYHEKEEKRAKEDGKASHKLDSGSHESIARDAIYGFVRNGSCDKSLVVGFISCSSTTATLGGGGGDLGGILRRKNLG